LLIRNVQNRQPTSGTSFVYLTTRQIRALRLCLHHSASNGFVNRLTAPLRISEVVSRHSRHTTPGLVIVVIIPSAGAPPAPAGTTTTVAVVWSVVTIIVTVVVT
jgi:hypothetical protein